MLYNKYSDLDGTSGLLGAFYEKQMLIGCINEKLQELDNDFIGFLFVVVNSFLDAGWNRSFDFMEEQRVERLKVLSFDADIHGEYDYPEYIDALQVFENMRHGMKYVPASLPLENPIPEKIVEFKKKSDDDGLNE